LARSLHVLGSTSRTGSHGTCCRRDPLSSGEGVAATVEGFAAQLDEQELAVLKNALDKVTVDCTFG
jgi:hypothetical protein